MTRRLCSLQIGSHIVHQNQLCITVRDDGIGQFAVLSKENVLDEGKLLVAAMLDANT